MRTPPARLFLLMFVAALAAVVGCSASPDSSGGGGGQETYGGSITPGDDGDDDAPGSVGDVGDEGDLDGPLTAVDDSVDVGGGGPVTAFAGTAQAKTTANLNLRKGPGTSYSVIAVIPSGTVVTVLDPTPKSGFLNVQFNGSAGWSSASYLTAVTSGGGSSSSSSSSSSGGSTGGGAVSLDGPPSPDNAIARAKTAVGFSYYWGGGGWLPSGATASTKGSCSGSCPSCSHSGKWGADCSGLVAKAWQFGTKAIDVHSHPYSTADFINDAPGRWSTVSRSSLRKGDALVYRSGGAGHIVIYEKGDGWGTPTVVECRACAAGCVYNARSFTSSYKGIRRSGF